MKGHSRSLSEDDIGKDVAISLHSSFINSSELDPQLSRFTTAEDLAKSILSQKHSCSLPAPSTMTATIVLLAVSVMFLCYVKYMLYCTKIMVINYYPGTALKRWQGQNCRDRLGR